MNTEHSQEQIIIPDEHGEEHLFDILFSFDVDKWDKSYVVVTPVEAPETEDEESQEVYAFRFEEEDDDYNLFPIETDEEWDVVEEMLGTFQEEDL